MSIRVKSNIFNFLVKQEAIRGDTVEIDIRAEIESGSTIRCQLRKYPDSASYYELTVENDKIIIPSIISNQLIGEYVLDVEVTKNEIVKTIQKNIVNFIPDITRDFGTEI